MTTFHNRSLLVDYINDFLEDQDIERFRRQIQARYQTGTLRRLLENSQDLRNRRAAALALGLLGDWDCNRALSAALRDDDEIVRQWAERSLWMIWFRGSHPASAEKLQTVAALLSRGRFQAAAQMATELIHQSPDFAEAYNQRAIAYWRLGDWSQAIDDCRKTLELNPQHFAAAAGMGQCFLRQSDRTQAAACFEKALRINPNLEDVARLLEHLHEHNEE